MSEKMRHVALKPPKRARSVRPGLSDYCDGQNVIGSSCGISLAIPVCRAVRSALLIAVLLLQTRASHGKYDPQLHFRTIVTENFYIHFHQGEERRAQKIAAFIEAKHASQVAQTRHKPFFRTHLVLSDISDMPNGFASFEPWNRIEMFAARPLPDSIIGYYRDWDEMLFVHEYNHILTLEQIYGLPGISRYLLGRVWFPNTNEPAWIIEGSAVAAESADGYGRNHSSLVEMYFRSEVEAADLKSINRASVPIRDWPAGNVHYIYGGRFAAWLAKRYPGKDLNAIHRENADNVWPYLNNTNSKDVFGKNFTDLWEEWLDELEKEQRTKLSALAAQKFTPLLRLTEPDFYQIFPRFAGDEAIYFLHKNNYERPALKKIRLKSQDKPRRLREFNAPHFLSVHRQTPYVVDIEFYRSFSYFADVFEAQEGRQLTEKIRAMSLDLLPSGELLLITQQDGLSSMGIYTADGQPREMLLGPTEKTLAHARLSPQGDAVVFTARDPVNAANHVYLLSLTTREILQLTSDNATALHPAFNPDGSRILFTSDRTGVFNLYELTIKTGELVQLTHLTGGAFYPDYSPDGKRIVCSEFTHSGYAIGLLDSVRQPVMKAKLQTKKAAREVFAKHEQAAATNSSQHYSVFPSILPSSWSPNFSFMNDRLYDFGVSLYGLDALQRDFIGITVSHNLWEQSTSATAVYENAHFYPDFFFAPSLKAGGICNGICEAGISGGMLLPFLKFYTQQYFYLRGSYLDDRRFATRELRGLLGYAFDNSQVFSRSVSPENGRRFGISTVFDQATYSDFPAYLRRLLYTTASYAEYLPGFFRNNVWMLRAVWMHSWNLDRGYLLWGPSTYAEPIGLPKLRGYASAFQGQGSLLTSAEYRFPIYQPDWGFFRVPVFFRDFYGKLFFDAAQSYYYASNRSLPLQRSAGVEIGLASIFGYRYMWSAYLGYARGFDAGGEQQIYFGVMGFTGILWAKYSPHSEFH